MNKKSLIALFATLAVVVGGVALANVISGWDSTNSKPVAVKVSSTGEVYTTGGSIYADAIIDDDEIDNCDDLDTSSEQYTLPAANDYYLVCVTGNTASVLCGTNPTATTAKNGHFIKIPSGACVKMRLAGTKCAHIAPSAAGEICYVQFNSAL